MWKTGIFLSLFSLIAVWSFSQKDSVKYADSQTEIEALATNQYKHFLSTHSIITSSQNKNLETLKTVSQKMVAAVKAYYKNYDGKHEEINKIDWEIRLFDKPEANAWCLPGGKIGVYSGLFSGTQSEASLGILLSNIIAHTLLKHGNERLKDMLSEKLKEKSLTKAITNRREETIELFLAAFGVGTNAGVWAPFSKKHELEADRLALQFSMLAGYHPREAIVFWTRMGQLLHSPAQPEFMSMHLMDKMRIKKLEEYIEEISENKGFLIK